MHIRARLYIGFILVLFNIIEARCEILNVIKNNNISLSVRSDGSLSSLCFKLADGSVDTVRFRSDSYAGPSFGREIELQGEKSRLFFTGEKHGIYYKLEYRLGTNYVDVVVGIKNGTDSIYSPQKVPFYLGIDTYMDHYPQWNNLYFPTFFRCEKNNFWGYFMTPRGRILSVSSPDPIGSYNYNYLNEMYGHYIYTISLDLLCKPPLPIHHPSIVSICPEEEKIWRLRISPEEELNSLQQTISTYTGTSFVKLNSHSVRAYDPVEISLIGKPARIIIKTPLGQCINLGNISEGENLSYVNTEICGLYWIDVVNENGKVSTGSFYVHPAWSWYLQRVREQSMVYVPRANKSNDSCETWYQLLGFYLCEKHFPDVSIKYLADRLLKQVLDSLFVEESGLMHTRTYPERIQNVSAMVSILSLKYSSDKDPRTLEIGSKCVDYLLSRQHETGYYGGYGMSHYTSVLYVAKSIMEFMDQIKTLSVVDSVWKERYDRYSLSVKRAMEELSKRGRDIKTEGQSTYEDGAVSCSASQLLKYALLQTEESERIKYMKAGLMYYQDHSCLTRLLDPDARSRGATSRFWECWGDIRTPMQAMLSPHGWSGWRLYASYYAYLLTGEYKILQQLMDAMGACMQLIAYPSGDLNYSFVVDPQYEGGELLPTQEGTIDFKREKKTSGYLRPIGDWYGRNTEGIGYLDKMNWDWEGAGTTFEIFKAMEEIVLCNAFVCENNEEVIGYNCSIEHVGKVLNVKIDDNVVSNIHFNLKQDAKVIVYKNGEKVKEFSVKKGMKMIKF